MRALLITAGTLLFTVGMFVGGVLDSPVGAQRAAAALDCGAVSAAQLRTTLYFGLVRPKGGVVTELDWQLFLRDDVTRLFPAGLTVWEAEGQWREAQTGTLYHEQSKVLLLVHPDSGAARESIQTLIETYIKRFEQESVLWESARVCVSS